MVWLVKKGIFEIPTDVLKWFAADYLWKELSTFLFLNVFSSSLAPEDRQI